MAVARRLKRVLRLAQRLVLHFQLDLMEVEFAQGFAGYFGLIMAQWAM